jgi:hypothetical protein
MLERMCADFCEYARANDNVMMPHTILPFDAQSNLQLERSPPSTSPRLPSSYCRSLAPRAAVSNIIFIALGAIGERIRISKVAWDHSIICNSVASLPSYWQPSCRMCCQTTGTVDIAN